MVQTGAEESKNDRKKTPSHLPKESRDITLTYMAIAFVDRYPDTKWRHCNVCREVNGVAWDSLIGRHQKKSVAHLAGTR